jgi:hypothetical protein
MDQGAGVEIGVAAVGGGDHIHAQLQGFRHAAAESFRSVQGEEHITAAVEGEELIALEAGHNEVDARIFCCAERLRPLEWCKSRGM